MRDQVEQSWKKEYLANVGEGDLSIPNFTFVMSEIEGETKWDHLSGNENQPNQVRPNEV